MVESLTESQSSVVSTFPQVVLSLPSLKYLDLRFNEFEGSVHSQLFDKDLNVVFFKDNRFRFDISHNLGNTRELCNAIPSTRL
ncbi:hypothetical protein ACFX2I_030852 [Malus domestica]